MSPRVIDLSVPLENGVRADPPGYEMSIENMGHKGIIDQWVRRYKGPQRFLTERPSHSSGSGSDPQRNAVRCVCHYGSTMRKLPTGCSRGCPAGRARWFSAISEQHTPSHACRGRSVGPPQAEV
jgi:hypothetical protein